MGDGMKDDREFMLGVRRILHHHRWVGQELLEDAKFMEQALEENDCHLYVQWSSA